MSKLTMTITGMTCGGCVSGVRAALVRSPGVMHADVKIGSATVTYDPAVTNPDALSGAVAAAGFTAAA
ncbi:MAG: heavy-metal-associated domain-containing protein [Gemmatimonadetes bacterium]|nr:heavy-metal-associated domain-containing protein [Gemmatimonadota bacterium]MBI3567280.1 heavy-metal-associated domain-containing protein [Gemmatimonadota bacterium]